MRYLVSGAAGFIGSHVCERLLAEGQTVVALDTLVPGSHQNLAALSSHRRLEFHEQDICTPFKVRGSVDGVLHLASLASRKDYLDHPIRTLMVVAEGTRNLLDLAAAHQATFLLASTSETYGDPLVHPQSGSHRGTVSSGDPYICYDESKRCAEALTMAYHRIIGLRTNIARIFTTYGPRMPLHDGRVVPAFLDQAINRLPITIFGDGTQTRSFCYIRDMVEGLCRLMRSGERSPVNLGNPQEITIREFADRIQTLVGSNQPLVFRPLLHEGSQKCRPDISKAQSTLGWEPAVPLGTGLIETLEYLQSLEPAMAS